MSGSRSSRSSTLGDTRAHRLRRTCASPRTACGGYPYSSRGRSCGVKKLGSGRQPLICSTDAAGGARIVEPAEVSGAAFVWTRGRWWLVMSRWALGGGRSADFLMVRRKHAIDGMAVGATVRVSEHERAATQSRSAPGAGEQAAEAGEQQEHPRGGLPPAAPAHPRPTGSARQRCREGRLPASSVGRRRAGSGPGRRNRDQLGPIRRGAGPRPALRKTVATVVAETLIPSPFSSPWMRMWPHVGFSRASRLIRSRVSAATAGRPSPRGRCGRFPCNSARCRRRSVCGLTAKHDQRPGW
jgi:hypothetical protein